MLNRLALKLTRVTGGERIDDGAFIDVTRFEWKRKVLALIFTPITVDI